MHRAADLMGVPYLGHHRHFHVKLDGRHSWSHDTVLVTGHLLDGWALDAAAHTTGPQKVLVRLRPSDWYAIARHSSCIRILHSTLAEDGCDRIIEADVGSSVVAGAFYTRRDETIIAAEIFSGAFSGWTQAATVLHSMGVPMRVKWVLDHDPSCWESARMVHPGPMLRVTNAAELQMALECDSDVYAQAAFEDPWWHPLLATVGLQLIMTSPPCPPWSTASSGPGVTCQDGKLLLRLCAALEVYQPPVVVLEQVAGFRTHQQYPALQAIWSTIGYHQVWEYNFDLADCAPGSRPRYLTILVRHDKVPPRPIPRLPPLLPKRPSLDSFQCLTELPPELLEPCLLSEEVLPLYLSSELLPAKPRGPSRQQAPQVYRVRSGNQQVGCIMAQYHYQHELPLGALQRSGLLGTLVRSLQGVRFLSGLETSFLHGLVRPYVLSPCDRTQMRHIGNSLSVPQAAFALTHSLQAAQALCSVPEPTQVIRTCLANRTHAGNFKLQKSPAGWIVYQHCQLPEVQQLWPAYALERPVAPAAPVDFVGYHLCDGLRRCYLAVHPAISLASALQAFGLEAPEVAAELPVSAMPVAQIPPEQCPPIALVTLPGLDLSSGMFCGAPASSLMWVQVNRRFYVLDRHSTGFYWALESVYRHEAVARDLWSLSPFWLDPQGCEIKRVEQFWGGCSMPLFRPDDPLPIPCVDPEDLSAVTFSSVAGPDMASMPASCSHRLETLFCGEYFEPCGWQPRTWTHEAQTFVLWRQFHDGPCLDEAHLLHRLAKLALRGCLQYLHLRGLEAKGRVLVCVQIFGCDLWSGTLPASLTFQDLLDLWHSCHQVCRAVSVSRLYSGPKPVPPEITLAQAFAEGKSTASFAKRGHLRVTYIPQCRGGGQKDLKYSEAQTTVAQIFMAHGHNLVEPSRLTDKVLSLGGLPRVSRLAQLAHEAHQWQELQSLCSRRGIEIPPAVSLADKAGQAVRREAAKRGSKAALPAAKDFLLQAEFFRTEADEPAVVLKELFPGCTGVHLADAASALSLIRSFHGSGPDELAVVVLGGPCPEPSSCDGQCSCPALNADAEPVLLSCCVHQLGERKMARKCRHEVNVAVPDSICLAVTAFRDEWKSPDEWLGICQHPVRALGEVLSAPGNPRPLESPWGRSFRNGNLPASPTDCTSVQFHAKVPRASLEALLRRSGFNRVYLTPKSWTKGLCSDYAVLWLPGDREAVSQAALRLGS